MAGKCPRDGTALETVKEHGIEIDRCSQCRGAWYDADELATLESTVADDDERRGMIDYAKHDSELSCPVCGKTMRAFNYRAYNLELDACVDGHGFWLDVDEAASVQAVMRERVAGLQRAGVAEAEWGRTKRGDTGGIVGKLKGMLGGNRR